MSKEAMKLALEALKNFEKAGLATLKTIDAITALKQALEQPEPEPVIDKSAAIRIATSLGWTPKREWQGLNYEDLPEQYKDDSVFVTGWLWAEAKLKEKNT